MVHGHTATRIFVLIVDLDALHVVAEHYAGARLLCSGGDGQWCLSCHDAPSPGLDANVETSAWNKTLYGRHRPASLSQLMPDGPWHLLDLWRAAGGGVAHALRHARGARPPSQKPKFIDRRGCP